MVLGLAGLALGTLAVLRLHDRHSDPRGRSMARWASVLLLMNAITSAMQGVPLLWLFAAFQGAAAGILLLWAINPQASRR